VLSHKSRQNSQCDVKIAAPEAPFAAAQAAHATTTDSQVTAKKRRNTGFSQSRAKARQARTPTLRSQRKKHGGLDSPCSCVMSDA